MRIVKIEAFDNGAHSNQTSNIGFVPEGYAVIPDDMETENFPFGEVEAEEIDGVMTVTKWTPGEIPEPVEEEPSPQEDMDAMLVDHEYRLTLLEYGLNG